MAQNLPQAPPQQRRGLAAYLLGMGPMPAPSQKEIAVATVIHGLDHPGSIELKHDHIIPQVAGEAACKDDDRVTVRVAVSDKLCRDIVFPTTIPYVDFFDRICAAMDIDPNTSQLGWKSNDEPKRSRAHQLSTEADMKTAFRKLSNMKHNPRRYKEVVMEIIFFPSSETNEKLPAIQARLCNASRDSLSKTDPSPRGLKRRNSSSSSPDDESDSEPLLLFGILQELHRKFPRLNFLQYSNALQKKGFDYAESVGHFGREYFVQLGLPEGVVVIFLDGVQKALERQKTATKRAKLNSAKTHGL